MLVVSRFPNPAGSAVSGASSGVFVGVVGGACVPVESGRVVTVVGVFKSGRVLMVGKFEFGVCWGK